MRLKDGYRGRFELHLLAPHQEYCQLHHYCMETFCTTIGQRYYQPLCKVAALCFGH